MYERERELREFDTERERQRQSIDCQEEKNCYREAFPPKELFLSIFGEFKIDTL